MEVVHPWTAQALDAYADHLNGGWRGNPPGHLPSQPARWVLMLRVIAGEVARIDKERLEAAKRERDG